MRIWVLTLSGYHFDDDDDTSVVALWQTKPSAQQLYDLDNICIVWEDCEALIHTEQVEDKDIGDYFYNLKEHEVFA